MPVLTDNTDEQ